MKAQMNDSKQFHHMKGTERERERERERKRETRESGKSIN